MSVGDQLRCALLTERGLNVTELARVLGIGRPALSNVLNGNASLSIPLSLKIEAAFCIPARALLVAQLDHEIEKARVDG